MKYKTFTVMGSGQFPNDMLRYDGAWPATNEDALAMTLRGQMRKITLEAEARPGVPTVGRWKSFGWSVLDKDGKTVGA